MNCNDCGATFTRDSSRGRICRRCREKRRPKKPCFDCPTLIGGKSVRCKRCAPKARSGANNPNWTGGRTLTSKGYVLRSDRPDHPNARASGKILEHTLVMSELLERPLKDFENVHHKNGVRTDNRPENLELWIKPQPLGIRAEDAVIWAHEILALYGGDGGESNPPSNERSS